MSSRSRTWRGGITLTLILVPVVALGFEHLGKTPIKPMVPTKPVGFFQRLLETYQEAWKSVDAKVSELSRSDQEIIRLRLENVKLKLDLAKHGFKSDEEQAEKSTREHAQKIKSATGSLNGRTPSSSPYRPPSDLSATQLFTLGVSYLRANENEKAAIIFNTIEKMHDHEMVHVPKNLILVGISWYRVENYVQAEKAFDEILQAPAKQENLGFQAQARLWKALIAKKTNEPVKAQFWLKQLIDYHPNSQEAKWVNNPEVYGEHKHTH